jgi:hypothetical protein
VASSKLGTAVSHHSVVVQVQFERHTLKPGLIFKGQGLKPVAVKLWVNWIQFAAPPQQVAVRGEGLGAVDAVLQGRLHPAAQGLLRRRCEEIKRRRIIITFYRYRVFFFIGSIVYGGVVNILRTRVHT